MKFALQDGMPIVRDGDKIGGEDCCCGCQCVCDNFVAALWDSGNASYGRFDPCGNCAYFDVTYPDPVFPEITLTTPVPVGMSYAGEGGFEWGRILSSPGVEFEAYCENSNYIQWLNDGSPTIEAEPTHPYWTATTISLVSKVWVAGEDPLNDYYLVEVFLDENCAASSLATLAVGATTITSATLQFGPHSIANFFNEGFLDNDPSDTLYLCQDPPNGVCCVDDGFGVFTPNFGVEALPCGSYAPPGLTAWYEDGTYDPDDPCSGDPFP